jgi:NAD(P)-dependent dehydrogenase (short-subunit alcohol dehydrogenase family)
MTGKASSAVIVTGAAQGLGRAYCEKLASLGVGIVAMDLDSDALQDLLTCLHQRGHAAVSVTGSVVDAEISSDAVAKALEFYGRLDGVIANAGFLRDSSFAKSTLDQFRDVMDVHLVGTFNIARAAWAALRESGHGRLVLTSSSAGLYGSYGQANYSAAKMGIIGLMNTLKLEGVKYGVLTNTVAPLANTRLSDGVFPNEVLREMDPEWISGIVAHLVSPECTANGLVIEIGAGQLRRVTIEPSAIVRQNPADKGDIEAARAAVGQLLAISTQQPADGGAAVRDVRIPASRQI